MFANRARVVPCTAWKDSVLYEILLKYPLRHCALDSRVQPTISVEVENNKQ